MEKTDVIVIGAGVIGLAIAAKLSQRKLNVILVERHPAFGREISSRNSEVIHAGIYYTAGSLKARLCVEGRIRLYDICGKYNIPHKKVGKLIVATDKKQGGELEELLEKGEKSGAEDLKMITDREIRKLEPNINAVSAIYSPGTGIIDSHSLMKYYEDAAKKQGVTLAYGCEVVSINKEGDSYNAGIMDADGERLDIRSSLVINCAGLEADKVSALAGIDKDKHGYRIYYVQGEYFRLGGGKGKLLTRLIYPCPSLKLTGLGIHTVVDMAGSVKLGPNAFYVDELNYDVDESHKNEFHSSVKQFLPFVEPSDLEVDMAGIRPKIQAPGAPVRDFVITNEKDKGLNGFINLIGIESPGLTAAPAIADYVSDIIDKV